MYVTEMSATTLCVTRLDARGQRTVVKTTGGRPNGLAMDGDGLLWIAEAGLRALICIAPDGREVLRIEGDDDGRFLFPNDLAFGPDGHLFMTDSGMAVTDFLDGQNFVDELPRSRLGRPRLRDRSEGRQGGPHDRPRHPFHQRHRLRCRPQALRQRVVSRGRSTATTCSAPVTPKRELFGNVLQPDDGEGFKGPDGMKFGADGRLYCTVYGQQNVTVLDPSGAAVERLPLDGPNPTNCAFALTGNILLVTEVGKGQVEAVPVPCGGLPLHKPKLGLPLAEATTNAIVRSGGSQAIQHNRSQGEAAMNRRELLKSATALAAVGSMGLVRPAFAANPTMTTVVKIVGVPYFSLLHDGLVANGKKFGIDADNDRPGACRSGPAGPARRGHDRQEGRRARPRAARREGAGAGGAARPRCRHHRHHAGRPRHGGPHLGRRDGRQHRLRRGDDEVARPRRWATRASTSASSAR